jgi:hypothetical protein
MNRKFWILLAFMALGLSSIPAMAIDATTQTGMFGSRSMAQPIAPRSNGYVGGLQYTSCGAFYSVGNQDGFPTLNSPWQPGLPQIEGTLLAAQPSLQPAISASNISETASLAALLAKKGAASELGEGLASGATDAGGISATAQGTGASRTWAFETDADLLLFADNGFTDLGIAAQQSLLTQGLLSDGGKSGGSGDDGTSIGERSARISDFATRIGKSRGLISSNKQIDVYMKKHVATVQGEVRNSSASTLLINIIRLEPGVWKVKNELTVEGSNSANAIGK